MHFHRASLLALLVAGAGVNTAALAASGLVGGLAQPDEALVQRYELHPEELAVKIAECDRLGLQEAVANVACVSTREVRYRRERNVIRNLKQATMTVTPAARVATTTVALSSNDNGTAPRTVAVVMDRRAP